MKVMITGGCGFIGHHFVEHILKNTDWEIVVVDAMTYASCGLDRIRDIKVYNRKRFQFFATNIQEPLSYGIRKEVAKDLKYIFHLAAETHVDRSIENAFPFVMSNVIGTLHVLEYARVCDNLEGLLYFSTDEVFGPAPAGVFYKEWDRYNCTNPYSASKAGGEELVLAYANTHGVPAFITHTMNCFGERQHPEKYIPKIIRALLKGEKITVHGDKEGKAGSRFYIHCRNVADAVLFLTNNLFGKNFANGEKYNIVGEQEVDNLTLAKMISFIMNKPLNYEVVDFHSSRPGHDLRYALDGSKMKTLGWEVPVTFSQSLERTVKWTLENKRWLEV